MDSTSEILKVDNLRKWLGQVQDTRPEEISCSECFDLISTYVDLEQSGKKPGGQLSQVGHHLGQCRVCREEYELLSDLARSEKEGSPPDVDDLRRQIKGK